MLLKRDDRSARKTENCHQGTGVLWFTEMLADYRKTGAGFTYIHDNHLEPGASIGVHTHTKDEEIYVILSGRGTMVLDGTPTPVGPGDVVLTRAGHSHDLTNGMQGLMHFLVICSNL